MLVHQDDDILPLVTVRQQLLSETTNVLDTEINEMTSMTREIDQNVINPKIVDWTIGRQDTNIEMTEQDIIHRTMN